MTLAYQGAESKESTLARLREHQRLDQNWQNEIVRWAVRRGRAALRADTGLGKTLRHPSPTSFTAEAVR